LAGYDRRENAVVYQNFQLPHYELKGKDRAKSGEKILPELAKRTGVSESLLGEIHLFYRTFPISHARGKLGGEELPGTFKSQGHPFFATAPALPRERHPAYG